MSRLVSYKIYHYLVLIGAIFLAYYGISKLERPDFIIATFLAVLFLLFYGLPLIIFGARVELTPSGLHVQQYADVQIGYPEVKHCFGFFLPPFHLVVIITRRRLPLGLLIGIQGNLVKQGTIARDLRQRVVALRSEAQSQ